MMVFLSMPQEYYGDGILDKRQNLVEAEMLGGLSGPGGAGIDLLRTLQAAGL